MIVLFGAILGAFMGYRNAKASGGNGKDMAQYAAVGAIVGALVGLFATIALERVL